MNKQRMLKQLIKYIADNFVTETAYAKHKAVTVQHVNAITKGSKPPTKDILKDIGLERVIIKKESYIEIGK